MELWLMEWQWEGQEDLLKKETQDLNSKTLQRNKKESEIMKLKKDAIPPKPQKPANYTQGPSVSFGILNADGARFRDIETKDRTHG